MDLIDREELLKDYTQTFVVGHGVKSAETFQGVVKQAQKVDAVPISVIEEIKADIIEMRKRDPLYYYVSTEDILDWVLNTIDRKVKEHET